MMEAGRVVGAEYRLRVLVRRNGDVSRCYEVWDPEVGRVKAVSRQAYRKAEAKGKPCRVQIVIEKGAEVVFVPGRGQEASSRAAAGTGPSPEGEGG